jgi:hypothetical protein
MGIDSKGYSLTTSDGWNEQPAKKKKGMLRYYIFCIGWIWKNRSWNNDRHKWKMMDRDYRRYLIAKGVKHGKID